MKTALEHHFEHVEERKQSKMQTLGASNPHNNNKDKHRQNTKVTGDTIGEIFNVGTGKHIIRISNTINSTIIKVNNTQK